MLESTSSRMISMAARICEMDARIRSFSDSSADARSRSDESAVDDGSADVSAVVDHGYDGPPPPNELAPPPSDGIEMGEGRRLSNKAPPLPPLALTLWSSASARSALSSTTSFCAYSEQEGKEGVKEGVKESVIRKRHQEASSGSVIRKRHQEASKKASSESVIRKRHQEASSENVFRKRVQKTCSENGGNTWGRLGHDKCGGGAITGAWQMGGEDRSLTSACAAALARSAALRLAASRSAVASAS